jgi:hypothetical protein
VEFEATTEQMEAVEQYLCFELGIKGFVINRKNEEITPW